ncbi:DUF5062 family protein [Thalassotalea atypica]|uniref:DUF5062 family protein n=1 Tax=Thalassotalea atypica TaxID=2054316 RepID=UPI00257368B6|nr:DUF5062 family protein [Thalassotalea atypica]
MKKIKNENQLLKKALQVGQAYASNRGFKAFEGTTSADQKIECLYRLLLQDKLVTPLAKDQENLLHMKHKLAIWISKQLPADHPLLN